MRLWREFKQRGFARSYSVARDRLCELRASRPVGFEVRFETAASKQARVDFAKFEFVFIDEPAVKRIISLLSMVFRYLRLTTWSCFVVKSAPAKQVKGELELKPICLSSRR